MGVNAALIDLNDKESWCELGAEFEQVFLKLQKFGMVWFSINPVKAVDPYAHDFFACFPCDLKTAKTPWVKSRELFDIDPEYAVSINKKDLDRYAELYPNIIIIFDLRYPQYKPRTHWAGLRQLEILIHRDRCGIHNYAGRVDDNNGNAKVSYVFDVREFGRLQ